MSGRSLNFNDVANSLRQCLRQCVRPYSSSGSEDGNPLPNIGDVRSLPEHGLHPKRTADKRSVAEEKELAEKYGLTLLDVGEDTEISEPEEKDALSGAAIVAMKRLAEPSGDHDVVVDTKDLDLVKLDGVEESSSEEKISTLPERALSFLTRDCVFATTAMVGVCVMAGVVLANDHALTVARLSVLIFAVTLTIFCCVLSELTKN
jgi:hypothetical protein